MKDSYVTFEYLYRDASNYKAWGTILLRGRVLPKDIEALRADLEAEDFFVAEQVGLPVLYQSLWALSGGPTNEDHAYHQFHDLRPATEDEISTVEFFGEVCDLLKKFHAVNNNWNCALSPNSSC